MNTTMPQQIDGYPVVAELGRGGMGIVYKAWDEPLTRHVALKVLALHYAENQEFIERFLREARTAASLSHPNIVHIYKVSETPPYYLMMELIEGESLAARLQREGALPPARAAIILGQIASALDYAHAHGVIHRDVKPANVLMEQGKDEIVLGDFGLARTLEGTDITHGGNPGGTAQYLAPEQARNQPSTAASDVYSLGVTLYEMLTGQVPFRGENQLAIMHQHANVPPPPPRHLKPELSPEIERIVLKTLAKEPRRRYASAGEMAREFSAAARALPTIAPTRRAVAPIGGAPSLQKFIYWGLGALAVLVILVLLILILNSGGVTPATTPIAANVGGTATPAQVAIQVLPTGAADGGENLVNPTPSVLVVTSTPTFTPFSIVVTATPPPPTNTPTETISPSPTSTRTRTPTRVPKPRPTIDPNSPCANPQAQITDPPANGVYKRDSVLTVRGTANRPDQRYFRVQFQPEGAIDWIQLYPAFPPSRFAPTSTAVPAITNGILMQWDLSTVEPGGYLLRLIVEDNTGSYFDPPCTVRVVVVP